MIIYNHTRSALIIGKALLLPGSNKVSTIAKENPILKNWVENGEVEIVDEETPAAVKRAIEKANTQKTVDALAKGAKDESVKTAAKNRKKKLDAFDKEAQAKSETESEL